MTILDTNVLSELMRPHPDDNVVAWIAAQRAEDLYITSVTQAEILHGILLLADGRRRRAVETAAHAMFREDFAGRILPFDSDAAGFYARIAGKRRRAGRLISQFDAQIAAIAARCEATVATRNTTDFEACGVELVDPWTA